jgi:methylmalonyl-CoA mutase N-terminal domain/subunit
MERYHKDIESKQRIKVGTNVHQMPEHEDTMLRDVAEAKIQPYIWHVERIRRYKERRDRDTIKEALLTLKHTARDTSDNLMDSILEAFEKGATIGEITGALRTAYDCPYDPYNKMASPL